MDRFSQAYDKARDVVTKQKFAEEWSKFLNDKVHLTDLLEKNGPNFNHASGLEALRKRFKENTTTGDPAEATAEMILSASKTATAGNLDERAATLKLLKHLYFGRKRGGQDVWVYSPPKAYALWVYDELTGPEGALKPKLKKDAEVYTTDEKDTMCDALQLALNWSLNATMKLAEPAAETKAVARKWFADEDTADEQLKLAMGKLLAGFKKIANVANSSKLVFSDEPIDRNSGGWKDWAFVYRKEIMDVVYLQGAFLKAGNTGKLWMCALTIIHELSHRAVGTDDHRYDTSGLKPNKANLPHDKAINNADSWAYFATDLAGKLSGADRNNVLS